MGNHVVQIPIIADTYIDRYNPNTSYGGSTVLKAGGGEIFEGFRNYNYQIFIKWDKSLPGVPVGRKIVGAKICMYCLTEFMSGEWLIAYYGEDFTEQSTFNDLSDTGLQYTSGSSEGAGSSYPANAYVKINAPNTSYVKVNYTTGYAHFAANGSNRIFEFASRESAHPPYLEITYEEVAPSQPTNLTPSNGQAIDKVNINRLSWQHNPVTPGNQIKFKLQWRKQGETVWNTVTQTTKNQYWEAPVNTFPAGYIEWQVCTTDVNNEVSPYSAINVFKSSEKPSIPVITSPANNSTIAGGKLTVQWISVEQVEYDLRLLDTNSNVLWQNTRLSVDKVNTADYVLANNTNYKIQLRVKSADSLWSNYAESNIAVVYATIPPPALSIEQDVVRGSLKLNIVNDENSMPKKVRIGLKGKTDINILGTAGDCEVLSAWSQNGATFVLDSSNKVYGSNSIKVTNLGTWGIVGRKIDDIIDKSKYYCLSGYVKNGDETNVNIAFANSTYSTIKASVNSTDATKFVRLFVKIQPSDLTNVVYATTVGTGSANKYYYVDGIMLNEITIEQYNDPSYVPPSYVNGDTSVVNPIIKICGKNMCPSFADTRWNLSGGGFSTIINSPDNISTTLTSAGIVGVNIEKLRLKPNTQYTVKYQSSSANASLIVRAINVYGDNIASSGRSAGVTFNSGSIGLIALVFTSSVAETFTVFDLQIEEGLVITSYEVYKESSTNLTCTLRECIGVKDEITQDGKLIQKVGYKVFDESLNYGIGSSATGYKTVQFNNPDNIISSQSGATSKVLKYNNKILDWWSATMSADRIWHGDKTYLTVANADSGWGDAYTPTTNEIKAYFMGWKMYQKDTANDFNGVGTKAWYPIGRPDLWTDILPTTLNLYGYTPNRLYYQLATPIETDITPIEISYIDNGTVEIASEVIPEYTLSAPQPVNYTNEIFRRKQGETNWLRLMKSLKGNTPYIDYTPQHQQSYEYKVRTILGTLAYADSNVTLVSVTVSNSQLALTSDFTKYVELKLNPSKKQSKKFERTQMLFAGKTFPVSEYSEHEELDTAMSFEIAEDELNLLDEILSSRQTILFRDSRGRHIFGTVEGYELEDIIPEDYIVSFTLSKVSYIEGV